MQNNFSWASAGSAAPVGVGYTGPVGRQVVLSGGGAELKGVAEYMQGVLGRAVRVGRPRGLQALPEAHGGPAFATLAGLALFAASDDVDIRVGSPVGEAAPPARAGGVISRLIEAVRNAY